MTAEVAILNKLAIALAADSAVTIGEQKTFNSANKLFALSKFHPVGIMVYGNAEIMSVPWEVVIKKYRKDLGKKKFPHLHQYAADFFHYLSRQDGLFTKSLQESYLLSLINGFYHLIRKRFEEKVHNQIDNKGPISKGEALILFVKEIDAAYSSLMSEDNIDSNYKRLTTIVNTKYKNKISRMLNDIFVIELLPKHAKKKLTDIAPLLLTKGMFSDSASGIVFAGFGDQDNFPGLKSYNVDCMLFGCVRKIPAISSAVTTKNGASIVPFAQSEMVHTFMEGIDPNYMLTLNGYFWRLFEILTEKIETLFDEKNIKTRKIKKSILTEIMTELYKDFVITMNSHRKKFHANPIVDAVGALPKDELAAMAESLVSLTSFKRRVSLSQETVGGPIDVAVISKGDGFVWIKRKHYFDPNLNPHFITNYANR